MTDTPKHPTSRSTSIRRDPHASADWYGLAPPRRYAVDPAFTQKAVSPAQTSRITSSASFQDGWNERPHSTV